MQSTGRILLAALALGASLGCASNLEAVRRNGDQKELAELALHDGDWEVRKAAVDRVADQKVLSQVALQDGRQEVRRAAIRRLQDQALLKKIALEDEDGAIRGAAVWALTDPAVITQVAAESGVEGVRSAALGRLADPAILRRLVLEDPKPEVRAAAVERLADPVLLAKVATEDREARVRAAAAKRVGDRELLAKLATQDPSAEVRAAAAGKLTDQPQLARIARADREQAVRMAAVGRLTDQPLLAKLAQEASDEEVREAAVRRIESQASLARIALECTDPATCEAAVGQLIDRALLAKVAAESQGEFVSNLAQDRLNELGHYPLLEAMRARSGAREAVRAALDRQVPQEELAAALHLAVRIADWDTCALVVNAGAPVNARDGFGSTPLLVALAAGRPEIGRNLLKHGADPSILNRRRMGPLHVASFDAEATRALVQRGATVIDLEVDDEGQEMVAFAFRWLGRLLQDEAAREPRSPALALQARSALLLAAAHFEAAARTYGQRASSEESTKFWMATLAFALGQDASGVGILRERRQVAALGGFGDGRGHGVGFYTVSQPTDAGWLKAKTNGERSVAAAELAKGCRASAGSGGGPPGSANDKERRQ
jgi:hypothetical protein